MKRLIGALCSIVVFCGLNAPARAADSQDPQVTIDNAIKALGGADQLSKIKAFTWTGTEPSIFNGRRTDVTTHTTLVGIDHYRQEVDGVQRGRPVKGVVVLAGTKGTRTFNGKRVVLDSDGVATLKQLAYLTAIPITILPLKDSAFKVEAIADETLDNKPAFGIKVTPPDNKDFRLFFDKATGLPVRIIAKIAEPHGGEYTMVTMFNDYQDVAGIKKAMKVVSKRNNETQVEAISDFKVIEATNAGSFQTP